MKLSFAKSKQRRQLRYPAQATSRARVLSLVALVVIATMTCVGAAIRGFDKETRTTRTGKAPDPAPASQANPARRSRLHSRLAFQPEANKMRRRLGQRFLRSGREITVSVGSVVIGRDRRPIRIVRSQDDEDGEVVTIAIGGGPPSLTWTPLDGAKVNGARATGIEKSLIERLALDSADQFVLAQTRGASYYQVAQAARPTDAGDSDSYDGPVWDLVRVVEPQLALNKPQSAWRLFYINSSTGMIDKVLYREDGVTVTAELKGWTNQGGETAPRQVVWTSSGRVLMELAFENVTHGPRQ